MADLGPHPQRKYYLSRKARLGILRRARKRGKELPATLKLALEMQSGLRMIDLVILAQMGLIKAYHINQRNEGIDLGDTAGGTDGDLQFANADVRGGHIGGFCGKPAG